MRSGCGCRRPPVIAGAVLALLLAVLVVRPAGGSGNRRLVKSRSMSAPSGRVLEIPIPGLWTVNGEGNGSGIALGARSIWVLRHSGKSGTLERLRMRDGAVEATMRLSREPMAVAFGANAVWVVSEAVGTIGYALTKVDPQTDRIAWTAIVGDKKVAGLAGPDVTLAVRGEDVFVAYDLVGPQLAKVSARSGHLEATWSLPFGIGGVVATVASNQQGVWIGTVSGDVYRVNPEGGETGVPHRFGRIISLSASKDGIWLTDNPPRTGRRGQLATDALDLNATDASLRHDTHMAVQTIAVDGLDAWGVESSARGATIIEFQTGSGQVIRTLREPEIKGLVALAVGVGNNAVWVADGETSSIFRVRI